MMLLHGEKRTGFYSRRSARSSARSCTSARSWPGSSTTTGSPFLSSTHRFENQFQDSWSWHCQCLTTLWSRQVVTLAVYSYFGAAVIGAQWVIPDNEQAYKVSLFLPWSHQLFKIKSFESLNSNQRLFFSASVQPPCGRYQGKVGLVLPVLPHHPVCLLLRVAQGDQPVQNIGAS